LSIEAHPPDHGALTPTQRSSATIDLGLANRKARGIDLQGRLLWAQPLHAEVRSSIAIVEARDGVAPQRAVYILYGFRKQTLRNERSR
jgi:hypothetical protein